MSPLPAIVFAGYAVLLASAASGGAVLARDGVTAWKAPASPRRRRHIAALSRAAAILASLTVLFAMGWLSLVALLG